MTALRRHVQVELIYSLRMRSLPIAAIFAICAMPLAAQTDFLKPEDLPPANGYSHVVGVGRGKLVFISGQVANNAQGQLVGKGDLKAQTEQVFQNLKTALSAAGTSFDHVVKITLFVKEYKPEYLPILREVRNRYVNSAAPPASSLVGVTSLFQSDYLIEVEAIAAVPEKRKGK